METSKTQSAPNSARETDAGRIAALEKQNTDLLPALQDVWDAIPFLKLADTKKDRRELIVRIQEIVRKPLAQALDTPTAATAGSLPVLFAQIEHSKEMQDAAMDEARAQYGHGVTRSSIVAIFRAALAARPAAADAGGLPAGVQFLGYSDADEHEGETILDLVRSRLEADPDDLAEGDVFNVTAIWVQDQKWRVVRAGNPVEVERISPPAADPVNARPAAQGAGDLCSRRTARLADFECEGHRHCVSQSRARGPSIGKVPKPCEGQLGCFGF
jgi:hypothetical protein